MAAGNIYIFAFFTALVAVNLIFAEESALEQGSEFFDQVDVGAEAEREARSPNEEGDRPQERMFFNLFPITTSCNYTTQVWQCFIHKIHLFGFVIFSREDTI
nr:uncharacterized protein LOC113400436 [Vanessa tameamea]